MGDRANLHVKNNDQDNGVYLYTHWNGSELPGVLRAALSKEVRWSDCQYLTRIIFDTMTEGYHGEETGYGISAFLGDGCHRVLVVNCEKQEVSYHDKTWTFQEYANLSEDETERVWGINEK